MKPVLTPHLWHKAMLKVWRKLSFRIYQLTSTATHCAFSSNLFHGQIAQIYIDHLSGPENKKCSPWKVCWTNHPQTWPLLTKRGPRSPDIRLSQHWPKKIILAFFKFLQKKVSRLDKKAPAHFCIILGVVIWKNHVTKPLDLFNKCRKIIFLCRKTFFCRNLKNARMSFLGQCNVETASYPGF